MSRRYKIEPFGGLWQVTDTKSKSRATNQFCSCLLKGWAVKIAAALNTMEARPTVRPKRAVQQLKTEIAALANELESLHVGDFDYGKGEIIIERMRQLSAV